jgi:hypothetical protein
MYLNLMIFIDNICVCVCVCVHTHACMCVYKQLKYMTWKSKLEVVKKLNVTVCGHIFKFCLKCNTLHLILCSSLGKNAVVL